MRPPRESEGFAERERLYHLPSKGPSKADLRAMAKELVPVYVAANKVRIANAKRAAKAKHTSLVANR